jgi:hypothetical protein
MWHGLERSGVAPSCHARCNECCISRILLLAAAVVDSPAPDIAAAAVAVVAVVGDIVLLGS